MTIDNPPDNFLDKDVLSGLNKTVSEMISSRTDLRVVLLTAKGKNFSAGIDYSRFVKMTKDEAGHVAEVGYSLLKHIENLPVPVIAAVKGETTGAGLGLALAADIRIASSDAVFSFPEAQIGVPPIFGSSQRLYKTVGVGRAKELLFTGRTVDAEEALRIGLVNAVVPADALDEEAKRLASKDRRQQPEFAPRHQDARELRFERRLRYRFEGGSDRFQRSVQSGHGPVGTIVTKRSCGSGIT